MALRAPPITGQSLVSVKTLSFSANRPCTSRVRKSSFLGSGGGALRLTYNDRIRCNSLGGGSLGSQMNLFARVGRIVKSYMNSVLSYFEDPEKILEQAVQDMNNDLVKLRQATASVMASQKQIEIKYKDAHQASEAWYKRAQFHLSKGEEGLARAALQQKKHFLHNKSVLKAQLDQQIGIVDTLISKTQLLERKIQEANLKKDALQARSTAAKATIKVQEMMGTVGNGSGLSAFERMEEKVLSMEFQAEAHNNLTTDDIDEKFNMLEGYSVEDELAELKRKQLIQSTKGELPPGRAAVPLNTMLQL
ncbi:Membrane-associated 30 kDa protein, chloroplastic [Melia azedarach]|uniref:Membrane-associated 30 kDa protein, chloroplastic n=1 Tax=Melia azedarach TaxID=155640 RepID=A0ACC1YFZ6_MELAZ|nr:Membrane-associated 30 kDa protein, chloroplastic [Melia azedarach]